MSLSPQKVDYLRVCNALGMKDQDFQDLFCARCARQECKRSKVGAFSFDSRTSSWRERLFTEVPRLDPSTPAAAAIRALDFPNVNPALEIHTKTSDLGPMPEHWQPAPETKSIPDPSPEGGRGVVEVGSTVTFERIDDKK